MFFSQKQMMARNAASMVDNPMAQQQKILLYVMPVFLAVISFQFPLGILLYWVTTNFWQIAQQAVILRESSKVETKDAGSGAKGGAKGSPSGSTGGSRGATSGRRPADTASHDVVEESSSTRPEDGGTGEGTPRENPGGAASDPSPGPQRRLPKRGGGR
jgi:YidC/Oxa1 family membrane protein insertase